MKVTPSLLLLIASIFDESDSFAQESPKNLGIVAEPFFSVDKLWPNFGSLAQGISSQESLSSLFIFLLLSFFGFGLALIFKHVFSAYGNIQFLLNLLRDVSATNLKQKRRDLLNACKANKTIGHLWQEFDETIVERESTEALYNIHSARSSFNLPQVAPNVGSNRLIETIPSILTSLGVIGTFLGLTLGLSHLDFAHSENNRTDYALEAAAAPQEEGDTLHLRQQIGGLIDGAKMAFITSVWGIFLSIVFTGINRVLTQAIANRVISVQTRIDSLFRRINNEDLLVGIESHSDQSQATLKGLAEEIGAKMQESITTLAGEVETSITSNLAPVLNQLQNSYGELTQQSTETSSRVLEQLMERFMESFGNLGMEQSQAIRSAATNINESISAMNGAISNFGTILAEHEAQIQHDHEARSTALNSTLEQSVENIATAVNDSMTTSTNAVSNTVNSLLDHVNHIAQGQDERDAAASERIAQLTRAHEDMLNHVNRISETGIDTTKDLLEQGRALHSNTDATISRLDSAVGRLEQFGEGLNATQQGMTGIADSFSNVSQSMSSTISALIESTQTMHSRSEENTTRHLELCQKIDTVVQGMGGISSSLTAATLQAHSTLEGMNEHQNRFLHQLQENMESSAQKMREWLEEYAARVRDQTNDRMTDWNRQTQAFCEDMTNVVNEMSNLVEEMEQRLPGKENNES